MHQWKFQIGDFVTPVVGDPKYNEMVVVSRHTEEFADHSRYSYICTTIKLGEHVRQQFVEMELKASEKTK